LSTAALAHHEWRLQVILRLLGQFLQRAMCSWHSGGCVTFSCGPPRGELPAMTLAQNAGKHRPVGFPGAGGRVKVDRARRMVMAEAQFTIGADVSCTDGVCGAVRRVVVDPLARVVTHLVVASEGRPESGRLVPLQLVDDTTGEIRLRCTKAEFEKLDPAKETDFVAGSEHPGYEPDQVLSWPYFGLGGGLGGRISMSGVWTEGQGWDPQGSHGLRRRTFTYDSVPVGEVQVRRNDHVHATDGEIGLVEGLVLDTDSHEVTHILLQEGHLWDRKEVAIPIGAVTDMEIGIQLNISKQQVEDLPPVDIEHRGR
jgi:hypothetical protein